MFFAWLLIILGIVFLLKNLGLISGGAWGVVWPLLIITLGLSMVSKRHSSHWCWWCGDADHRHQPKP